MISVRHQGLRMEYLVVDRETIESGLLVPSAYVVISIRDPGRRKAKVRRQSGLRDTLYLAFHDAEPTTQMILPPEIKLITLMQARRIRRFVAAHQNEVNTIVVHCEQGMSRSPAVAAAVCKSLGGDDRPFWKNFQPNRFVYQTVLQAFESAGCPRPTTS